jgi:hypothetical protein
MISVPLTLRILCVPFLSNLCCPELFVMKQNIVKRKIMWGDLDPLGIVFYPRYYQWLDACGHLFFEAINLNIDKL